MCDVLDYNPWNSAKEASCEDRHRAPGYDTRGARRDRPGVGAKGGPRALFQPWHHRSPGQGRLLGMAPVRWGPVPPSMAVPSSLSVPGRPQAWPGLGAGLRGFSSRGPRIPSARPMPSHRTHGRPREGPVPPGWWVLPTTPWARVPRTAGRPTSATTTGSWERGPNTWPSPYWARPRR